MRKGSEVKKKRGGDPHRYERQDSSVLFLLGLIEHLPGMLSNELDGVFVSEQLR